MATAGRGERRWSERQPVELRVTLSTKGQCAQVAVCRDLGIGGMYVDADTQLLQLNEEVHVGFSLGDGDRQSHHRVRARLVRVLARGAGLMFSDFTPETVRALREALGEEKNVLYGMRNDSRFKRNRSTRLLRLRAPADDDESS